MNNKYRALRTNSFAFTLRIVRLDRLLCMNVEKYGFSKQMLRSGTAVGASIREIEQEESASDLVHKLAIALKEDTETEYLILSASGNRLPERKGNRIHHERQ